MNKVKSLFFLLFITGFSVLYSQNDSIEIQNLLVRSKASSQLFRYDEAIKYANDALRLSQLNRRTSLIFQSFQRIGDIYSEKMNSGLAMSNYTHAMTTAEMYNMTPEKVMVKIRIITILFNASKTFEANKMIRENLSDAKKLGVDSLYADCNLQLAQLFCSYSKNTKTDSVLPLIKTSIEIFERLNQPKNIAFAYSEYGFALYSLFKDIKAIEWYKKAMDIYTKINDNSGFSMCLKRTGDVYYTLHKNDIAIEYYLKAHKCFVELGNPFEMSVTATDIAYMYGLKGDIDKLHIFSQLAETYVAKNKSAECGEYMGRWLSEIYEIKKDYTNAYKFYKIYKISSDSMSNNRMVAEMLSVQTDITHKHEIYERELQYEKEKAIQEQEKKHQKFLINISISGIGVLMIFLLFVFNSYSQKKKQNKIITQQKTEVENQKILVEEKNKEISDSINYAQRIQKAILPLPEEMKKSLENYFVLLKPCNVVSGDFFWFKQKGDRIYIAAADCTGHGVPGALMSMIGNTLLHEIVESKNIVQPAEILNELRKDIIRSLKQTGAEGENQDGMDIALCMIQGNKVEFAGANNPLWLIRNNEFVQYRGDKQPVGITYGEPTPFTNNVIDSIKGDALYLFTDGYADQFGGPKGKKFKYSQLKSTLLEIQSESMEKQSKLLDKKFTGWKGDMEQIDDVLLIGVRL